MAHKKAKRLWWISIIALANYLVKLFFAHIFTDGFPYGIVITGVEMVAGDYFAPLRIGEVFNTANVLYNKLAVCN